MYTSDEEIATAEFNRISIQLCPDIWGNKIQTMITFISTLKVSNNSTCYHNSNSMAAVLSLQVKKEMDNYTISRF